MKVSDKRKQETREALVCAAAELFVEQGFDKTTMKQVAKRAEVGDATIYKYFPNKDKLIIGFYDVRGTAALAEYHRTEGLEDFSFAEKLQLMIDTFIEQLTIDREFVEISLVQLLKSPISLLKNELNIAQRYRDEFQLLLEQLNDDSAYPDIPLQGMVATLLTDCLLGITLYWMKDDSEEFSNTTQLTDLSVGIVDTLLKSGLINKAMEVAGFVIKTHVVRSLSSGGNLLSMMQEFSNSMSQFARESSNKQ